MMASRLQQKKRKAQEEQEVPEDDLHIGLDGAFSQSEDESDDESFEPDLDELEGDEDESEDEASENDSEDEDDAAVLSDGAEDNDDELDKVLRGAADAEEPEIEEPGVDPKPQEAEPQDLNYRIEKDANGGDRYVYDEIDPVYDSDDSDAKGPVNTIGNIPLSYYDGYPHIGYDISGKKIMRPAAGEALDSLLESIEVPKSWTGLTDLNTGNPLNLSKEELEIVSKVQRGVLPEEGYDPYPDYVDYFTGIEEKMPLSAAPEPKRRFLPSKHEAVKIMKLVRAIREGRILPYRPPEEREEEEEEVHYDIWQDEVPRDPHVMHIPAPKLPPPGYDLSYNPPPEYLPTEEEREAWKNTDPEERDKEYLPAKFDALRKVPGYDMFVKERFDRSLDLYLAPRVRKNRLRIDPMSLLPRLPRPEELRPYPSACQTIFRGHDGRVRTLQIDPTGCYLATGGDDGTVRVWELLTGRELWKSKLSGEDPVDAVRWRPGKDALILSAAAGEEIFLIVPLALVTPDVEQASRAIIDAGFGYDANGQRQSEAPGKDPLARWARPGARLEDEGVLLKITVKSSVKTISWHRRGDHFCTVAPRGQKSSVIIHTLHNHKSQNPFRKFAGMAQVAHFHPSRPMLFVATQRNIRCYDLQKLELVKVVQPGARWISSFDIHHGGDNVIVGSYDKKMLWHDMDLSTRPYKSMRFHSEALRSVKYHNQYPLFASASDDGTIQVLHGKVVTDLMENATIVPLKILKGHKVVNRLGIMEIDWHPRHPWLVSAGADGTCRLYT